MRARALFWPCVLGLAVMLAPSSTVNAEPPAEGDTVVVSKADIAKLFNAHRAMLARIAQLEQQLEKAAGAALACYASNDWSGQKWRG